MLDGVVERVFQLAVIGHGRRAETALSHDADHGVACGSLPHARFRIVAGVVETLFVHSDAVGDGRPLRRGHGHVDALALAVAVSVGNREREAVRALGVRVRRVAVGAVGVHRQRSVLARNRHAFAGQRVALALAVRRRDRERLSVAVVRAEVELNLAFNRVARRAGDNRVDTVRYVQRRHVVGNHHAHHAGSHGTVGIRHRHYEIVRDAVLALARVLLRGLRKMIGIVQPSGRRIKAGYLQVAFIRGHGRAREPRSAKHLNAANNDGSHSVKGLNHHITGSRDIHAFGKPGLIYPKHVAPGGGPGVSVMRIVGVVYHGNVAKLSGIPRRDDHRMVNINSIIVFRSHAAQAGHSALFQIGQNSAVIETDVQPAQAIQPIEQSHVFVLAETGTVRHLRGGPGGRHKVRLVHGREEILTRNFRAVHGKRRHILTGIGGIKIFETYGATIIKSQDEMVVDTGQCGGIHRKIKNETRLRFTNYVLGYTYSRLDKAHIRHGFLLKTNKTGKKRKDG